jgi:secondary thiamine-phosphate synthase enzyme
LIDPSANGSVDVFSAPAPDSGQTFPIVPIRQTTLSIKTSGQGMYEITEYVAKQVKQSGLGSGVATIFCQHTSCSLVTMENADPSARRDLEDWLCRLVGENDPHFEHTAEGPDDMPSHIKMALTRSSETVPFSHGRLLLGTWQGVFLWEHRRASHSRNLVITVVGE